MLAAAAAPAKVKAPAVGAADVGDNGDDGRRDDGSGNSGSSGSVDGGSVEDDVREDSGCSGGDGCGGGDSNSEVMMAVMTAVAMTGVKRLQSTSDGSVEGGRLT
jgi:hypothetical protein